MLKTSDLLLLTNFTNKLLIIQINHYYDFIAD